MNDKVTAIRNWSNAKVGTGYVYGATGWICTKARREQQAKQYPQYAGNILGICAQWDGKEARDCAQYAKHAMAQVGITLPSGATSQWKTDVWAHKGTIDTLPKDKLCCLFRADGSVMQHVLIYHGDATDTYKGTVTDARGSAQGVIKTLLGDYKYTHWAVPKGLYEDEQKEDNDVPEPTNGNYAGTTCQVVGGGLNMRASRSKQGVKIVQIPVGTRVYCYEDDGAWPIVRYKDGVDYIGFVDRAYLKEVG